jgi:hypothetical protein
VSSLRHGASIGVERVTPHARGVPDV